uniref:Uncharacterized protein n=1 Tax=Arion vulgaris TaxID=1028688 RepID=A0A0B7AX75_9EUPU
MAMCCLSLSATLHDKKSSVAFLQENGILQKCKNKEAARRRQPEKTSCRSSFATTVGIRWY